MQVKLYNLLDRCPDSCPNIKVDIETIEPKTDSDRFVDVIFSCDHIDVCYLNGEHDEKHNTEHR